MVCLTSALVTILSYQLTSVLVTTLSYLLTSWSAWPLRLWPPHRSLCQTWSQTKILIISHACFMMREGDKTDFVCVQMCAFIYLLSRQCSERQADRKKTVYLRRATHNFSKILFFFSSYTVRAIMRKKYVLAISKHFRRLKTVISYYQYKHL